MTNWNMYKKLLGEKIADARYNEEIFEKQYRAAKARRMALEAEEKAFEDSLQITFEQLGIEVEDTRQKELAEVGVFFEPIVPALTTKLTKDEKQATYLQHFSGNV